LRIGVFLGIEKTKTNDNFNSLSAIIYRDNDYKDPGDIGKTLFGGFDIGIGLNYNFNV